MNRSTLMTSLLQDLLLETAHPMHFHLPCTDSSIHSLPHWHWSPIQFSFQDLLHLPSPC
uniref:Uncharacterized protein n=1 Tax=Arundo donax TaxID=35708 RepID=A0A0A9EZZ6_ARUDO